MYPRSLGTKKLGGKANRQTSAAMRIERDKTYAAPDAARSRRGGEDKRHDNVTTRVKSARAQPAASVRADTRQIENQNYESEPSAHKAA